MLMKFCKIIAVATLLLGLSLVAQAGQPFDAKAFQQAQTAGKTILVDVTASWCPTCRQQRPIVQYLSDLRRANPRVTANSVSSPRRSRTVIRNSPGPSVSIAAAGVSIW